MEDTKTTFWQPLISDTNGQTVPYIYFSKDIELGLSFVIVWIAAGSTVTAVMFFYVVSFRAYIILGLACDV